MSPNIAGIVSKARSQLAAFLFFPRTDSLIRYSVKAYLLGIIPTTVALFIVLIVQLTLDLDPPEIPDRIPSLNESDFLSMVIVGPIAETVLLGAGIGFLSLLIDRPKWIALISAVLWGSWHGFNDPLRFVGTVWPFFVLSCAFMAWWKQSLHMALGAALLPHSMVNCSVLIAMTVLQCFR